MQKHLNILFTFFTIFFISQVIPASAKAANYFVATNGSDSTGTGTIDKPFATLNKAQSYVSPGSTVFVRGGTYRFITNITKGSGTASAYVTYQPYEEEKVLIDGSGLAVTEHQSLITLYKVSYVKVDGFEIANSTGRGISATEANNVIISNNKVHDTKFKAIGASGNNITIDNNEVYNAVMVNANGAKSASGWPQAVSTWKKADGSASQNIDITNNYIYNSWGEGIDAIALDGGRISGNRVRDTYSVLIYTDNSRNLVIDGNYLTATNTTYYRGGYPAVGIMISAENCCIPNPSYASENITVSNNLVVHTKSALRYWSGDFNNPYNNLKVFHNTFKDSVKDTTIYMYSSSNTYGNEMKNNIIYGGATMPNASAWTFANNNWPNGKPSVDNSTTFFAADPLFVDPVPGGPAEGYKLQENSSSIGKGTTVPVVKDYFGGNRINNSTIGFYEHNVDGSAPTATPVIKIGDANGDFKIDDLDYAAWLSHYNQTLSGGVSTGDFDNSGKIDGVDYVLWANNYGK